MWRRKRLHSADMRPAGSPAAPQAAYLPPPAHRISAPLLSPLPFSDPTHFPFILAYLRDGHVPPLPSGLLELQQLRLEAEFFAMTELAAAAEAAVAAIEARSQAAREVEEGRAAALRAAEQAVAQAQQKYDDIAAVLAPLRATQQEAKALSEQLERQVMAEMHAEEGAAEADPEEQRQLLNRLEVAESRARELHAQLQAEQEQEGPAAARLWAALLARLCALGADLPAAEAQLRVTHPHLARRSSDSSTAATALIASISTFAFHVPLYAVCKL